MCDHEEEEEEEGDEVGQSCGSGQKEGEGYLEDGGGRCPCPAGHVGSGRAACV